MKKKNEAVNEAYVQDFLRVVGRRPKGNEMWILQRSLSREETIAKMKGMKEREEDIRKNTPRWIKQGEALKKRRQQLNLSMRHIAHKVGVSASTISKVEKGLPIRKPNLVVHGYRNVLALEEELVKRFALELTLRDIS